MNLQKLFETQAALDEAIFAKHPELKGQNNLGWKVLALQVELGECANEWRGFKKWSNDQEPRNFCGYCIAIETPHKCENPLLEEYVDCLHFLLSIGLEIGTTTQYHYYALDSPLNKTLIDTFSSLITDVESLRESDNEQSYVMIMCRFLSLGEQLGFTPEQTEAAYFEKNKVNHERQESGY